MRNGCECAVFKKSRAITPRTIDLSKFILGRASFQYSGSYLV